jgi:hypothetical protein
MAVAVGVAVGMVVAVGVAVVVAVGVAVGVFSPPFPPQAGTNKTNRLSTIKTNQSFLNMGHLLFS